MIMLSNATTNTTCMLGLLAPLSFAKHRMASVAIIIPPLVPPSNVCQVNCRVYGKTQHYGACTLSIGKPWMLK